MNNTNKKIFVAVTTDVYSDMRVRKTCSYLVNEGATIEVVGRVMKQTFIAELPFKVTLLKMLFSKGFLFYAEFNLRFFMKGLFKKFDIIVANDLDTLLSCFILSKIKKVPIVYDSHEYFTESAGLLNSKFPKYVWTKVEQYIFPKLKRVSTVNQSIADFYIQKYKVDVKVIKNVPNSSQPVRTKYEADLGIDEKTKLVILQGSYIDDDRGGLELVKSFQYIAKDVILYVIGAGQEISKMKAFCVSHQLESKVVFFNKMPYSELEQYTLNADLAISIDKPTNLNYTYSLPNKLFDYMNAGVPILASNLPEIKKIFSEFEVGMLIDDFSPEHIAKKIREALSHPNYGLWKENCKKAALVYTWENECKELNALYSGLLVNP